MNALNTFPTHNEISKFTVAKRDKALLELLDKRYATIDFEPTGRIISANANFLAATGYRLSEVEGRHHSMFMQPADASSVEYSEFWNKLARGEACNGTFRRKHRNNEELWLLASYNPVYDESGRIVRVVKLATDVTGEKVGNAALDAGIEALGRGDLSFRVSRTLSGDYETMRLAFNTMMANLESVIGAVSRHSSTLDKVATTFDRDASDLEIRSQNLAESIGAIREISADFSKVVENVSSKAARTEAVMGETTGLSEGAAEMMQKVVASMHELEKLTNQVNQVTRVIDGVATQTNMLSINASVEAARAGDAGRGFAVVASEVRMLAERSASASSDIDELILKSIDEVANSVKLVDAVGSTLNGIRDAMVDATSQCSEINQETQGQTMGMSKISTAILEMNEQTEQLTRMSNSNRGHASSVGQTVTDLRNSVSELTVEKNF